MNEQTNTLDLSKFEFPIITGADLIFSTTDTNKELLAESENRELTKGREKFNELFFKGGKIEFQNDVKGTWKEEAYMYAKSLMRSWSPKHEHKESVCAMIFEETLKL